MKKYELTQTHLKKLLSYDQETGEFRWLLGRGVTKGTVAGYVDEMGYRRIMIDGKMYRASHLAWLYTHGVLPRRFIDHKNRIGSDNRIENLREATDSQNSMNCKIRSDNTSGYQGVSFDKRQKKYQAYINVNGNKINLGYFKWVVRAAAIAKLARMHHFGEFAI